MMNTLNYKGYIAKIEFSSEDKALVGNVINANDILSFHSVSVEAIESEFHEAIDSYLQYCEENNIEPSKSFNGKFQVRADEKLHKELFELAAIKGCGMNDLAVKLLQEGVTKSKLA